MCGDPLLAGERVVVYEEDDVVAGDLDAAVARPREARSFFTNSATPCRVGRGPPSQPPLCAVGRAVVDDDHLE
jgi:hypothetical protein